MIPTCIRIRSAFVLMSMTSTSKEDIELDRLWREAFNQPLPLLGAPDIAKAILDEHRAKAGRGYGNALRSREAGQSSLAATDQDTAEA